MKQSIFSLVIFMFMLSACSSTKEVHITKYPNPIHPTLYATLFVQQAAEYKALCYQTFNFASMQLNAEVQKDTHSKPLAVVVDVDETVLDNIPYQSASILGGFGYPVRWSEWMHAAAAQPIPGSLEFLSEANKLGVAVFYVTNRREEFRDATLKNLQELGFPDANNSHLMLRITEAEKESRRMKIMENYEIIILVGDNLGDLSSVFEDKQAIERTEQTKLNKKEFGKKWFVLPNPVYGNWVDVLPGYDRKLAPAALNDSLLNGLIGF